MRRKEGINKMGATEFNAIRNTISNSIEEQKKYDLAMKYAFIFVCELFFLWQLCVVGFTNSYRISVVGVIGALIVFCTFISLRIYRRTAAEFRKHGNIIVNEEITSINISEVKTNIKRFYQAVEKYKAGKTTLLIMNAISMIYIIISIIMTFVMIKP